MHFNHKFELCLNLQPQKNTAKKLQKKKNKISVECCRRGENRGKSGLSGWWGPQRAVVMGPDHPSGLAESPLRPGLHAGMDARMNKWSDRRRQKSSGIIRAAGTVCWKHLDGKRYHWQHQQLGLGLFVVELFNGASCSQVY